MNTNPSEVTVKDEQSITEFPQKTSRRTIFHGCYSVPIFVWTCFVIVLIVREQNWGAFGIGMVISPAVNLCLLLVGLITVLIRRSYDPTYRNAVSLWLVFGCPILSSAAIIATLMMTGLL